MKRLLWAVCGILFVLACAEVTAKAGEATAVSVIGSWSSGTTHNKDTGTNRALVLLAHAKSSNATAPSISGSVTYGGQTMTPVVSSANSGGNTRTFTAAYILDDAGITAATGSPPAFSVTFNNAAYSVLDHVFLQDVNQASLYGATDSNQATSGATISTVSSLAAAIGDMVIGAATASNTGTYTANNGFNKALESNLSNGDSADINKAGTGADETPSVTSAGARQTIVGFVVKVAAVPMPDKATGPSPSDGATGVGVTTGLSWTAGGGATSHDVYFGTESPGTSQGNQAGTTFDTGTMDNNTTYYWRIDERNESGTTTGDVWSFTTIARRTVTSSSSAGGDVITPGEGEFSYDNGSVVIIAAFADQYYHFVNWTGTAAAAGKVADPNSANTTVTMDANYTVIANFANDIISIKGTVTNWGKGLADVNMDGLSVITDTNGFYIAEVNAGWSGAVTPQKDGCNFDPNSRSYTNVTLEQADQNYIVLPSDDFNDDRRGSMWRKHRNVIPH